MKTKLILSAVVAASIALSSSVFAVGPSSSKGPGFDKEGTLLTYMCQNKAEKLQKLISSEIPGTLNLSPAEVKVLKKIADDRGSRSKICRILYIKANQVTADSSS